MVVIFCQIFLPDLLQQQRVFDVDVSIVSRLSSFERRARQATDWLCQQQNIDRTGMRDGRFWCGRGSLVSSEIKKQSG